MVNIEINNFCNNSCTMCSLVIPPCKRKSASAKNVVDYLNKLDKNTDHICFTGGEPTINPDFVEMLDYINKEFPNTKITVVTNARLLAYKSFVEKLEKINNLFLITELHGDEKLHDRITNVKGSFRQSFEGIKNVLDKGFEVEIRIVVSKLNYKQVVDIAKIYKQNFSNADRVVIFPIDITGNAFRNKDKVMPTYTEIVPYVEEAVDYLDRNGIKVRLFHFPFCVLKSKYWRFVEGVTIAERRLTFADVCKGCDFEEKCPRVWKTYAKIVGVEEFRVVKGEKVKSKSQIIG